MRVKHPAGVDADVEPSRLIMVSAASEAGEISCQSICHTRQGASEKDRLDAIGVCLSTDVAAFAVQGRAKSLGQRRDVVAEEEVRFLGNSKTVDVDPCRLPFALQY